MFLVCSNVPGCEGVSELYQANRQCNENGTWGESGNIQEICLICRFKIFKSTVNALIYCEQIRNASLDIVERVQTKSEIW